MIEAMERSIAPVKMMPVRPKPARITGATFGPARLRTSVNEPPALISSLRWLVLQPQQRAGELAAWLAAAGFRTLASARPSDRGRSYTVLVVTPPL